MSSHRLATPLVNVGLNYLQVGNFLFKREQNPSASDPLGKKINTYLEGSAGNFRALKIGEQICTLANEAFRSMRGALSPALSNMSKIFRGGWMAMAVPDLYGSAYDAYNAVKKRHDLIRNPGVASDVHRKSPWQVRKTAIDGASKLAKLVSSLGYVGSLLSGCDKATAVAAVPLKHMAETSTALHDGLELVGTCSELAVMNKTLKILSPLKALPQKSESQETVLRSFRETHTYLMLQALKVTLSAIGSFSALAAMAGLFKISAFALLILGITISAVSVISALHKQSMKEKPIQFSQAFKFDTGEVPMRGILRAGGA